MLLSLRSNPQIQKYIYKRVIVHVSQTSFSLYLHNQWTDFHKLSYTVKPYLGLSAYMWDVQKQQQTTEILDYQ